VDEQAKIIKTISKEEIDELAKKYLDDDNLYILVVGDGATNREKLEKLGYELVELDEKGAVIKDNKIQRDK
jgi:zinc protease